FPLVTYADAAKRAELIAQVTASRYMPPWKPERGYGDFEGARVLTPAEIGALRSCADSSAPQSDPSSLRPAPAPTARKTGQPALTVRMPRPFSIAADGPDLYRCFVVPLGFSADRYADSIEFRPGNAKVVHHSLFFRDRSGVAGKREGGR